MELQGCGRECNVVVWILGTPDVEDWLKPGRAVTLIKVEQTVIILVINKELCLGFHIVTLFHGQSRWA